MDQKWYYAVDGARQGPVAFDELSGLVRSGQVGLQDLVWQPEFGAEWRAVAQVPELAGLCASEAPADGAPFGRDEPLLEGAGTRPSPLDAVAEAYSRTVSLLFRPFDLTRWFSVGFCAWLSTVGTQLTSRPSRDSATLKQQVDLLLDRATDVLGRPESLARVGVEAVVFVVFAVWLCWIRSRGDFMFLRRWYTPEAPIRACWQLSRVPGRSLFAWRMGFALASFLLLSALAAGVVVQVVLPYVGGGKVWGPDLLRPAVLWGTSGMLLVVGLSVVAHLAKAFVVPVMYGCGVSASRAWRLVLELCNQYPFAVLGYLACTFGLALLTVCAVAALALMTCCVGLLPLLVPYVGSVTLLPPLLFFRGYPVCFLGQWRPDLVPTGL